MAKNRFGLKEIDEALTYAIYNLVKRDADFAGPPKWWSAQELEENLVSGIHGCRLHPLDEQLIDQYYGPLSTGLHGTDSLQVYQYAVDLAKKHHFMMIDYEDNRPFGKALDDPVMIRYCKDDVKFKLHSDIFKAGVLKHRSEIKSETKSEKPSTSGLSLKAGPSSNVARQTPYDKKKDPNAPKRVLPRPLERPPKRPLSAFFLYSADNRDEVRRQLSSYGGWFRRCNVTEVASELGRMWRAEDPATKAHYKAMSQRNMEKYKMDMEAYYNRKFISFLEKPRTFDDY